MFGGALGPHVVLHNLRLGRTHRLMSLLVPQPGGQSWGARKNSQEPPPSTLPDMLQMLTWEEVARKPVCCLIAPPRDYLHLAGRFTGLMWVQPGLGPEKLRPRRNTSACSCGLAAG